MRFPFALVALSLAVPAWAQDAAPAEVRLEGTLTQKSEGASVTGKLFWEGPDSLKVEILRDNGAGVLPQIILAKGEKTSVYEPATRRIKVLPYNVAKEWWRGWALPSGGPANFFFTNSTPPEKAPKVWHRDAVFFGGGGDRAYYAAYKSQLPLWPQIELTGSPATSRKEKDEKGKLVTEATLQWSETKLPTKATVSDRGVTNEFEYALQNRGEAFPAGTFELPAAAGQAIPEDQNVLSPSAYPGNSATALWNRGAALALGAEDFRAAQDLWVKAAQVAPEATAPVLSAFDLALGTRELPRAQAALERLGQMKLDPAELAVRQAKLALVKRDYNLALGSAASALQASPNNPDLKLLQAQIMRASGDADGAQRVLLELLAAGAPPQQTRDAARALANLAAPDLLATMPAVNEGQKLAKVLLQVRLRETPDTLEFSDDEAQAIYAESLERAGLDARAQVAWTVLANRSSWDSQSQAHYHLAGLATRRGNADLALTEIKAYTAGLSSVPDLAKTYSAFFDGWQKGNQMSVLYRALQNRAQGRAVSNEDLKLWMAWQEAYGTTDDIQTAMLQARGRFPNDAYWLSKNTELLVTQANDQRGTELGLTKRNNLFRDAMDTLDKAIAAEPNQPFYAMQRALVAVQRATPRTGVVDASRTAIDGAAAKQIFNNLLKQYPNDPDISATVAVSRLGLNERDEAMEAAQMVLDSAPGDGERHTLVLAARQTLAKAQEKRDNGSGVAAQFDAMLLAAQNPTEQAGLAASLMKQMLKKGNEPLAATLLTRTAGEPWGYTESRAVLNGLCQLVSADAEMAPLVLAAVKARPEPASRIAEAALAQELFEAAQEAINTPQAPPAADAEYERATANRAAAFNLLPAVAGGDDPLLAGRAAALLAENTNGTETPKWMKQAVASEPIDAALRLTLADSLVGAREMDAARLERDLAARLLQWSPETARSLALLSLRLNDPGTAWRYAELAYNEALTSTEVDANGFQRIAFAAARVAFATNNTARGADIYLGLATPQWTRLDQAAALLALRYEWQTLGRNDEVQRLQPRIDALQLTDDDREVLKAFMASLAG